MSALTKMPPTETEIIFRARDGERSFLISSSTANQLIERLDAAQGVDATSFMSRVYAKYGRPACCLSSARHKAQMTQAALSQAADVPQSHISDMERGKRKIGKAAAQRLAKVLHARWQDFTG